MQLISLLGFLISIIIITSVTVVGYSRDVIPYYKEISCNKSEFFQVETLSCAYCDSQKNLKPASDKLSCVCDDKSKIIKDEKSVFPTCLPCQRGEVPSSDKKSCISCSNITEFSSDKSDLNDSNTSHFEREINGKHLNSRVCVDCIEGTKPSPDQNMCIPCFNNSQCTCPVMTHEQITPELCIPRTIMSAWPDDYSSYMIEFPLSVKRINSHFLRNNLRKSLYMCKMRNRVSCQTLANMCVMVLYQDDQRSGPCRIFRDARHSPTLDKEPLPWLYYGEGDAPTVLARKKILTRYSLDYNSPVSSLKFSVAQWTANGSWLGVVNVTSSSLFLCNDNAMHNEAVYRFGAQYHHSCIITAQNLMIKESIFYELYLITENQLYAVPVLIKNLKQGQKYPNKISDKSQWQLTRRFFLLDKVGGVSVSDSDGRSNSGTPKRPLPSFVRYVKYSSLSIKVQDEPDGFIYPPLLTLEYDELAAAEIEADVIVKMSLDVKFYMDNYISYYIEVWIGVLSAVAVIWAAMQTWTHSRRAGRTTIDLMTLIELCLITAGHLSNIFFMVISAASIYIFVFYKGQAVVQLLLPEYNVMYTVKVYIIVSFCLKLVEVSRMVWYQICIDIFLVDWERPRIMRHDDDPSQPNSVSIWRTYFVANEWNEIQTRRKTSITFQLVATVFLLEIWGLREWATSGPDLVSPYHSESPLLRFSVFLIIYLTLYITQWLFLMGVYERYVKNAIQEFVDVCSLANISVFVLALENFGYYIHGRSAHGFADTDMKTIMTQLKREEDDLVGHRGLLPASDQQTFQMFIPSQLRDYYQRVMASISNETHGSKLSTGAIAAGLKSKVSSSNIDLDRSGQAYQSMNKFLAAFLEHALKDLDYEVREKLFVEALLDIEFSDSLDRGVFYCDNGHAFDNVLFYGNEATLVSLDIIVFCFIEVLTQNYLLAAVITASVAKVLDLIRRVGGRKNLAKKTLIDERFLI
ncbi:meckelin [Lycorma delicatula]|uniref:meckelin n=1 Tax=Lycorma delicatula TaxID=130591 RepID=UPI003F5125F8